MTAACLFASNPGLIAITGLNATDVLRITARPAAPPVLSGGHGAEGAMARMFIKGFVLDLSRQEDATPGSPSKKIWRTLVKASIALEAGLDIDYVPGPTLPVPGAGSLAFGLVPCGSTTTTGCTMAPEGYTLLANFPNPFVSAVLIDYILNGTTLIQDQLFPALTGAISGFELPSVYGFDLVSIDERESEQHLSAFFELHPDPLVP